MLIRISLFIFSKSLCVQKKCHWQEASWERSLMLHWRLRSSRNAVKILETNSSKNSGIQWTQHFMHCGLTSCCFRDFIYTIGKTIQQVRERYNISDDTDMETIPSNDGKSMSHLTNVRFMTKRWWDQYVSKFPVCICSRAWVVMLQWGCSWPESQPPRSGSSWSVAVTSTWEPRLSQVINASLVSSPHSWYR